MKYILFILLLLLPANAYAGNNLLPKEERQKLILERAMEKGEARRKAIEERKKSPQFQYYYYYQYYYSYRQYRYPYLIQQPAVIILVR